jgi:geranylgeranyl diphosphate synthase type I
MPVESLSRIPSSVETDVSAPAPAVAEIERLLDAIEERWVGEQPELAELTSRLRSYIARGGKRLRPLFCTWGAIGAGGDPDAEQLVSVCAALELLHAFALIHDDVMDGSATRRGHAALHVELERRHRRDGWSGEARRTSEGLAVLVGDFAFVLAELALGPVPLEVQALWHEMRLELVAGQWVDMMSTARADRDGERARWVARYKSGRYTVERPLHLGAVVAGRPDLVGGYSRIGRPLGQAFQLRDDIIGVFGSADVSGKPAGDDLREGKATTMLALASERVHNDVDRRLLGLVGRATLGDSDVHALRELFVRTGALHAVEREIDRLASEAMAAVAALDLEGGADSALCDLIQRCAWRDR